MNPNTPCKDCVQNHQSISQQNSCKCQCHNPYANLTTPKNKCCEKCYTNVSDKGWPMATMEDACLNLTCPCHSPVSQTSEVQDGITIGLGVKVIHPNEHVPCDHANGSCVPSNHKSEVEVCGVEDDGDYNYTYCPNPKPCPEHEAKEVCGWKWMGATQEESCVMPKDHAGDHTSYAQEAPPSGGWEDALREMLGEKNNTWLTDQLVGMVRSLIARSKEEGQREENLEHIAIIDTKLKNDPNNPVLIAGLLYWKTVAESRLKQQ